MGIKAVRIPRFKAGIGGQGGENCRQARAESKATAILGRISYPTARNRIFGPTTPSDCMIDSGGNAQNWIQVGKSKGYILDHAISYAT